MLQRNLFAIIIVSLGLVLTSNAFGQWHPEIDKIKSPSDVATGQSTGLITEISFPAAAQQRSKTTNQYNPKELSVDKVVKGKDSKWEGPDFDAAKNSFSRPKNLNLGDTATHVRRRRVRN